MAGITRPGREDALRALIRAYGSCTFTVADVRKALGHTFRADITDLVNSKEVDVIKVEREDVGLVILFRANVPSEMSAAAVEANSTVIASCRGPAERVPFSGERRRRRT